MTQREAFDLLDMVAIERGGKAYAYQIGSGAWVVRLRARDYWLWDMRDWQLYRQALEEKARESKAKRKRERREVMRGIDPAESYALAL